MEKSPKEKAEEARREMRYNQNWEPKDPSSFTQDWSSYNKAQRQEHQLFMQLLSDLTRTVDEEENTGRGRPSKSKRDMIFNAVLKVYSQKSLRRAESLIHQAEEQDLIQDTASYATISDFMQKEELTNILETLITLSATPLSAIENEFAVDATGFSTSKYACWQEHKHGNRDSKHKKWLKAHVACGVKTNIVTSARASKGTEHDINYFEELVRQTNDYFEIEEVSADKAYSSRDNHNILDELNGKAYIPFASHATGKARGSRAWKKMYHTFANQEGEFKRHYHKRSNVETSFHMIKEKFGDHLSSKKDRAQRNELLAKVLCHNICVIIQEIYSLDIRPKFG
jgi:transposase